jgi:hypothetical protein
MDWEIFKELVISFSFLASSVLFIAAIVISFWPNKFTSFRKIIFIIILYGIFVINSYYEKQSNWVPKTEFIKTKNEFVNKMLTSIDQFKRFDPKQRLRSNILFVCYDSDKNVGKYRIRYSYKMDVFSDKLIEIPINMGCTGEAWRTKNQIWGDKKIIFSSSPFRIPDEELEKVPKDLEWVCSTPIVDRNGNVAAVLNFDGNRSLGNKQKDEIKKHCQKIAEDLKDII